MIHNQVADAFCGRESHTVPLAPELFHYVKVEQGDGYLVEIKDNQIVVPVAGDYVRHCVMNYYRDILCYHYPLYGFPKVSDIESVVKLISSGAPRIADKDIHACAPKDYRGFAFYKLPYTLDSRDPTPVFDAIFDRITLNKDALKAWFGSLCDPKADHSQLVYLHGPNGGEGKSELIEFIHHVFGRAATAAKIPEDYDRFWEADVYNKRVATIAECDERKAIVSTRIKGITGNKVIRVEEKGRPAFVSITNCKFFVASNMLPDVKNIKSNSRRLIFAEIAGFDGEVDPNYRQRLIEEERAFLSSCWRKYRELCPRGGVIPVEKTAFNELVTNSNVLFDEIFDEYFIADPDLSLRQMDVETLFKAAKISSGNSKLVYAFIEYLKHNRGLSRKVTPRRFILEHTNETVTRKNFYGVGIKPQFFGLFQGNKIPEVLRPANSTRSAHEWDEFRASIGLPKLGSNDGLC